jgi:hypothetical protein
MDGAVLRYMNRGTDRYAGHKDVCLPTGRKPDPVGIDSTWMRTRAASPLPEPPPEIEEDDDMSSDRGEATPTGEWGRLHVPVNGGRYLRIASSYGDVVKLDGISIIDDTPAGAGSNGKTVQTGGTVASDRPGPWDLAKTDVNHANYSHVVIRYQCTGPVKAWINNRP